MKKHLTILLTILSFWSFAQVDMSYYLPGGLSYNPDIPTPKEVLGYHPGEWHVSHDQLLYYMREVAAASDRMIIDEIGRTYEGRPLVQITISNPVNLANLDQVKADHKKLTDPSASGSMNTEEMPIVMWLGYSVHGNEASGSNAALITAYYLAAAIGAEIDEMLENSIIILDPSFNPDGLHRFSSWVNMHRSHTINPDPNDREYDEVWPGGRTNHYWFDLNRDWLPLAHPESRARIARFHEWKPNILTDHHEMGTNSTFFFQPGIPSRKFPWTPDKNVELTHKMAAFHAQYLDDIGSLYYSEESFDDFYIGKGSTYPDVNGSVGILFEQASSRGHAQENDYGILTFPMAVKNHFTASLSTLASGIAHRKEFLDYQKEFYQGAANLASRDAVKAYVFGSAKDPVRNYELAKMLVQHEIEVYEIKSSVSKNGKQFSSGNGYIVPMNQSQYRLAKAIFETRTSFTDSLFYDVSTWTMPLAFNLPYAELGSKDFNTGMLGEMVDYPSAPTAQLVGEKGAYAYAIEPYGYLGFRAINRLLSKKVVVQMLHETHSDANRTYPRGTMIIPVGVQENKRAWIEQTIDEIVKEDGVNVYSLNTGLARKGVDLGSRSNTTMKAPKIAVLVEGGVSSYEAGEVWHLLDQRFKMKVTKLPVDRLSRDLSRYNRIVIPNMWGSLSDGQKKNLKEWISQGGVVIAWKNGGKWLSDSEITSVKYASRDDEEDEEKEEPLKAYENLDEERGAQVTGGSIFEAKVDLTHPLAYGMESDRMPLFRNHNLVMERSKNEYANPIVYTENPLLSGYVSEENLDRFKNSPAVTVSNVGRGKVITLADNPNFRAFWYGTNKIFMNALFFGEAISRGAGE
ncbi:Zinc carboxypeptidase [Ekhidna lutea]|uniref:Zinc carboxypeptidase n=1 Tax=Ekhidna lutea TaxID=447679 RepID=A0A239IJ68_EKHLU|nr:M14 family metallopeptidase [Ekhidna lutea]SNS92464.1 Zinc carboxypeptidase [Ekhidna lutea]